MMLVSIFELIPLKTYRLGVGRQIGNGAKMTVI